ncbi:MAG: DUF366 family protein [Candidatus Eisenbacteria sp.]|nr:DUF366 family protein [Candidatus Eisenbacteria bacterium]
MKRLFLDKETVYTGRELRSHWAYRNHGLQGDSIVGFAGSCDVPTDALVDEADRKEGAFIRSEHMLHFLVEHFERDLEKAILRQLFLVCLAQEEIHRTLGRVVLERRGDDLFCGEKKLSVSVATLSPVSSLIHLGLNISAVGAPVRAIGLADLGVAARPLGEAVMEAYAEAVERIPWMKSKVRGVE